jgi:hypothetical protein
MGPAASDKGMCMSICRDVRLVMAVTMLSSVLHSGTALKDSPLRLQGRLPDRDSSQDCTEEDCSVGPCSLHQEEAGE